MEIGLGLECIPIERVWNSNVAGSCLDLVAFSYFTNITNLITDVWVFLLPLPIIFKLHVTQRRKFEVAGVFAVGLFTCGVTLARLTVVVSQGSSDFTWSGVPLGILSKRKFLWVLTGWGICLAVRVQEWANRSEKTCKKA
ncbi:hypothetical protein N7456_004306 [Penicillium angulare]|uniref:Rhodopsin domain-containing protein n=1 Tax=Penicillium angulare TaxID=116970 RepID=A0A9W9FWB8_9EURO|nr:hypothetical protein N7456_004306 [Penicillium angulare]